MTGFLRGLLFAAIALLAGCPQDDAWMAKANLALDTREQALNQKNVDLYLSVISRQYGGEDTGYTKIKDRAESLFKSIEGIKYTSSERSLYHEDGRVRAVQRFVMELERDGGTKSMSGQEQIFLQEEAGAFKIVDGL